MDNLKGFDPFSADNDPQGADYISYANDSEDAAIEAPPLVSTDERRMQVRAYNFWTALCIHIIARNSRKACNGAAAKRHERH